MKDFTIVLCSRKREKYLQDCLEHIELNSKTDIEVIVGCDLDDIRYLDLCQQFEKRFPFCRFIFRNRCDSVQDYLNFMARGADSKYVFVINDDYNIVSKFWDSNAKKVLDDHPLVYGKTLDNSIDKVSQDYTGVPIISKAAINKLGWMLDPRFPNHGSDVTTYRIYAAAQKVVDLSRIVRLDHVLHNSVDSLKLKEGDETNREMIARTFSSNFNINDLFTCDISKYIKVLNE